MSDSKSPVSRPIGGNEQVRHRETPTAPPTPNSGPEEKTNPLHDAIMNKPYIKKPE